MKSQPSLELHFVDSLSPQLVKTVFSMPNMERPIIGSRGLGFSPGIVPFKWTTTLHAIALCLVKARLSALEGTFPTPLASGRRGSVASSIDYAIWQMSTRWTADLFGHDNRGRCWIQRILTITNSRQKRPGPTIIFLRETVLQPSAIRITLDGTELTDAGPVKPLYLQLLETWQPWRRIHRNLAEARTLHNQSQRVRSAA